MIVGIIILICVLYLIYDMFGEYFARKVGWKNKWKTKDRMRLLNFQVEKDKQLADTLFRKNKHNNNE